MINDQPLTTIRSNYSLDSLHHVGEIYQTWKYDFGPFLAILVQLTTNRHSAIAGPWAWTLDPENAGLWTDIAIQKHQKIYHFGLVCLRPKDFGFK